MGRGLTIALVASLALNIFGIGFISGRVLNEPAPEIEGPPKPGGPGGRPSFRMMHYADALPAERREEFREAFRERLPAMRDGFQDMRRLRMEMAALLGAEDFDREAVEAKFQELHALQQAQQDAFSAAFLDAFETLTPEERQMLREASENRRKRHPRRRRHAPTDEG